MSIFAYLKETLLTELNIPTPQRYFPDGGGGGSFEVYDRKTDETIVVQVDVSINPRTKVLDTEFTVNGSFHSTDRGHGVGVQVIKGVAYVILQAMKYSTSEIDKIEFSSRENDGKIDASKGNQREKLYRTIASYVAPQLEGWENFDINRDYEVGVLKKPQGMTEGVLTEVTADDKYTKQYDGKLDREVFNKFVSLDPTGDETRVGKYVDWLVKQNKSEYDLASEEDSEILNSISDFLGLFDKFNSKIPAENRDINKTTLPKFIDLMDDLKKKGTFQSKKDRKKSEMDARRKETEFIMKNDKYTVLRPMTQKASQYWTMYGGGKNGCSWCTGAKNDSSCHFGAYDKAGTLYIVFDSKDKDRKWQIIKADEGEELPNVGFEGNKGTHEYRDCNNDGFDPYSEFSDSPELIEWLEDNEFPEFEGINVITDEEKQELAQSLARYTDSITSEDGMARAVEIFSDIIDDNIQNYFYDSEQDEDIGIIDDNLREGIYNYEQTLEELEALFGTDSKDEENVLNWLWSVSGGEMSVDEFLEYNDSFLSDANYSKEGKVVDIETLLDNLNLDERDIESMNERDWSMRRTTDKILSWYDSLYPDITSSSEEIIKALTDLGINLNNKFVKGITQLSKDKSETREENPQQTIKFESALKELGLI